MSNQSTEAVKKLQKIQKLIDARMAEYFESTESRNVIDQTIHGVEAYKKLKEFSLRPAKRLRGALAYSAYQLFGGKSESAALDMAVATELIQNYLLIIDDVMDRSPSRRGRLTVHEQYFEELAMNEGYSSGEHVSNMIAVTIGAVASHMAAQIMLSLDEKLENVLAANKIFQFNVAATGYGQIEDLYNDTVQQIDEEAIMRVLMFKTSYYTFINPLQTAAVLAGRNGTTLKEIEDFGKAAGIAFQLQDDIIGMFGAEDVTGKSAQDDVKEGKMTMLVHYVLKHGSHQQALELKQALGNPDLTNEQHARVKEIVVETGALKHAREQAQEKASEAFELAENSTWPDELKQFTEGLMKYVISREK